MTTNPNSLPQPPQNIRVGDGLAALRSTLDRLLPAPAPDAGAAPAKEDRGAPACTVLRRRLAVRGWAAPIKLLDGIPESEHQRTLRTVGQEIELAERTQPGRWFMTIKSRKRVFLSTGLDLLYAASDRLCDDDDGDPVRLALRVALSPDLPDAASSEANLSAIEHQPDTVLAALSRMAAWGSAIPRLPDLAAAASALHRRLARDKALEAVEMTDIFGRADEQQAIDRFLDQPSDQTRVKGLYVSGIGGSGKSTLLLAAEKALRQARNVLVVRLDFDNPYLDPLNPEQMDILFLRALSVEEPLLAPELQRAVLQLESLAEHRLRKQIDADSDVQSSSSSRTVRSNARRLWRARYASGSGSDVEAAGVSVSYERISVLASVSYAPGFRNRGVVLLVDTLENVGRLGDDGINSVLRWLGSISNCVPNYDLRVVLAGRDKLGTPNMQALTERLSAHGIQLEDADGVVLDDLDVGSARALLEHLGMPDDDAALAATALPRNPLVLRMAADTYQANKADVTAIQRSYQAGQIDRATASSYLAQRVVQHVPRPPARRYALAAMALPEVTERQLRDIVIPVVDNLEAAGDAKLARKVYDGLRRSTWLTTEIVEGKLRWHTELRNLAMPMIRADTEHAEVAGRVHSVATVWHQQQRTGSQRKARYHGAEAESFMGDDDQRARAEIERLRLNGVGGKAGEGDRLVAQGHAAFALEQYRQQPERHCTNPPNYVLRALAQTGDWDHDDIDHGRMLQEVRRQIPRQGTMKTPMAERLYWYTRLWMLSKGSLAEAHVALLRDACRMLKFRALHGALFGLVGMAEALSANCSPQRLQIAPAQWPPADADVGPELRLSMVRTIYRQLQTQGEQELWITTTLGALLVFDARWPDLLEQLRGRQALHSPGGSLSIDALRDRMQSVHDSNLAEVEQFVATCRDVRVRINLAALEPYEARVLLRGTLVEFHSPLATLLCNDPGWAVRLNSVEKFDRLLQVVRRLPLPAGAVLTLAEFRSQKRREQHARNLQSAFSAIVVMLDRAQVLANFCRALVEGKETLLDGVGHGVRELAGRYMAWDDALVPPWP